jgi:glutathione S-transferase
LFSQELSQADISIATAWRFIVHNDATDERLRNYPALAAFSARAESLPQFLACPVSA